ncbi:hypothetical protein [Paenibacillus pini]|uniref:Uncharacterized protein n=1 Tax=Paenibacillus pini JCM 16418 TaxID=1236976 RepID=W7YUC1_9BACL|nr:hypothetical protein [Paenibacillus pini]GAF10818.1 hypothetical protein JCM16418_5042 [Paenibacillus pini JCM 16418]
MIDIKNCNDVQVLKNEMNITQEKIDVIYPKFTGEVSELIYYKELLTKRIEEITLK